MYIDFKNNIKYIRTTSRGYKLFTRGNCPEPCLGQFFLEFTPICNQKPAVQISKKKKSNGRCFIVEKLQIVKIGEAVKFYQYFQYLF